jgi:hypothetical protein
MRAPQTATIDWKNKNTNRRKKKSEREGRGKKENWKKRRYTIGAEGRKEGRKEENNQSFSSACRHLKIVF